MADRFDIVIAGASHTGLAMALAFVRLGGDGLRIGLVDAPRQSEAAADPRAFALSAASRRLLDRLGVWSAVVVEAEPVRCIEITDSSLDDGVRPVLLTYDNALASGEAGSWIVPGAALLAALQSASETSRAISRVTGRLTALEVESTGVGVELDSGVSLRAGLVVGADGARSAVRDLAGIKVVRHDHAQLGIVTAVALDRPHEGRAVQHFLPGGPFAILPLPGDRACITWSEPSAEARRILALDDAGFAGEIEKRFSGRLGRAHPTGPRGSFPLATQLARAYVADRIALVGDAAHAVHPIAGQGLNLALRDVAALAECVVDAMMAGLAAGDAAALERYAHWRRFDATVSAAGFGALNALFSSDVALLRTARDAGLGVVDCVPALKRVLVAEAAGTTGTLPKLLQ